MKAFFGIEYQNGKHIYICKELETNVKEKLILFSTEIWIKALSVNF